MIICVLFVNPNVSNKSSDMTLKETLYIVIKLQQEPMKKVRGLLITVNANTFLQNDSKPLHTHIA